MIGAVFNLLTLFWDILTDLNKDLVHLCWKMKIMSQDEKLADFINCDFPG